MTKSIAIILPAYNEELTIVDTMKDFFSVCPEAEIYVIDNASKDRTNELARAAYLDLGCKGKLMEEPRKGKAAAVRKAFLEIDADIYVIVDSDMTYPASDLPKLLAPVFDGRVDIVCGNRHSSGVYKRENKRPMHDFGNNLVRWLINTLFNGSLEDILTGYRIMSKRFVKNYPILSDGFEIETEMSIHALDKGYSIIELPTDYRDRPEGSFSKLNTITDGVLVIKTIFSIFVRYRPLLFFTICAVIFAVLALAAGSFPVIEYFQTSKVTRFPLAILASGLSILAMLSFAVAAILHSLAAAQRFNHALALLHWHDITREK
ncbi:MAG: glycosyltransferase family 2 protein [Luteolibacter sp.]|jgi:glycosyltransferase involved in cell wall biosynthesis|nr:glycosyltransferase family 2 protein [Luteolibacter sp.]